MSISYFVLEISDKVKLAASTTPKGVSVEFDGIRSARLDDFLMDHDSRTVSAKRPLAGMFV